MIEDLVKAVQDLVSISVGGLCVFILVAVLFLIVVLWKGDY